jgi:membrane protein
VICTSSGEPLDEGKLIVLASLRSAVDLLRKAVSDFFADDAMSLGAALAFYSALSLAPLLLLLLWGASLLDEGLQAQLVEQIRRLVGEEGGRAVAMIVRGADRNPDAGTVAGVVGLATLLFSASGAFGQLQVAMNRIWNVRAKPGQGIVLWLRKRLFSFGMVLTVGFLLLVSLALSAALSFVLSAMPADLPFGETTARALNLVVSLGVATGVFALMFQYLPDARVAWRDVWLGALATALLFSIGKYAIGVYLGTGSVGSAYGAAGSLVALLVWVYYSALIVFLGAELTQAIARRSGRRIEPEAHAVLADSEAREAAT